MPLSLDTVVVEVVVVIIVIVMVVNISVRLMYFASYFFYLDFFINLYRNRRNDLSLSLTVLGLYAYPWLCAMRNAQWALTRDKHTAQT